MSPGDCWFVRISFRIIPANSRGLVGSDLVSRPEPRPSPYRNAPPESDRLIRPRRQSLIEGVLRQLARGVEALRKSRSRAASGFFRMRWDIWPERCQRNRPARWAWGAEDLHHPQGLAEPVAGGLGEVTEKARARRSGSTARKGSMKWRTSVHLVNNCCLTRIAPRTGLSR